MKNKVNIANIMNWNDFPEVIKLFLFGSPYGEEVTVRFNEISQSLVINKLDNTHYKWEMQ